MLVYINGRFLTQNISGVQRYSIELLRAFDRLIDKGEIDSKEFSFLLIAPKKIKYAPDLRHIPLKKVGYLNGHLWEQFELPYYSRDGLLINLGNSGPLLNRNQIVTIHDASVFGFPKAFSFFFRFYYKILLKVLVKIAKRIITVSSFSKAELIRYCSAISEKIDIIYLGSDHILSIPINEKVFRKFGIGNRPYILAVSNITLNKNFDLIIRAIQTIDQKEFDVIVVGKKDLKIFNQKETKFDDNVKYLGYINDNELRALYEHAICFIYPSFYEGFGLPPLEAMACGCPVIVSNTASMPEICGDAAIFCDPRDPNDLAEKISQILKSKDHRDKQIRKGLEHVKGFTWSKCAKATFEVIKIS